ncbi:hypothetical protein M0R72_00990 [Candidatus Pacearchaeota archaeon]|jgi:hypothetical protein|nr:hypothetical protein [Candidatus Pacearchaeota archaeon]
MGKISQFLQAVKAGLVQEIPPEYQACESCRRPNCDSATAAMCEQRILGERQESQRRVELVDGKDKIID